MKDNTDDKIKGCVVKSVVTVRFTFEELLLMKHSAKEIGYYSLANTIQQQIEKVMK